MTPVLRLHAHRAVWTIGGARLKGVGRVRQRHERAGGAADSDPRRDPHRRITVRYRADDVPQGQQGFGLRADLPETEPDGAGADDPDVCGAAAVPKTLH